MSNVSHGSSSTPEGSSGAGGDQDLDLKLRFRRILFLMGYYSPIEVELSHYYEDRQGTPKRTQLTDLDVLGIRYDELLSPHRIVADCKSGKNVSDASRLFWLRGVADYFVAHDCYFLRPNFGTNARAIAPKLSLRLLDSGELAELERRIGADRLVLPIADRAIYVSRENLWGIRLAKGTSPSEDDLARKEVFAHLAYAYWYLEPHRNLFQLINQFREVAHLLRYDRPQDILLAYTGLERFALCLLDIGNQMYRRGLADVPSNARLYLYGGHLALRERKQMMEYLSELTRIERELDPPYLPDVLESVNRLLATPHSAPKVLPYMEAIYLWCVLLGNPDLTSALPEQPDVAAIVLASDLAITFCRSTGLTESLFAQLLAL